MRNRVREVGILLLVLGLLTVVLGGFIFFSAPDTNDSIAVESERIAFALNCVVGTGMVAAFFFVDEHPEKTIVSVLVGWFLIHIVVAVLFPIDLLSGFLGKFAILLILGRGFVSARAARVFRKDLARKALQGGG